MINIVKKPANIKGFADASKNGIYYYAAYSRKGTIDTVTLAKQMSETSSAFTKGEVVGVTIDLPTGIKHALLAGQAVTINGLGTFKPSLSTSEIKANKDELKASAVSIKSLNFAPDASLLKQLNEEAVFQWIDASAASAEDDGSTDAAGNDTSDGDSSDSGSSSSSSSSSNSSSSSSGSTEGPSETGVVSEDDPGRVEF